MKTKLALFAVAITVALASAAPSAHADSPDLAKAKRITGTMMVHVLHMATILDRNLNTADKAVAEITAYFNDKKRMKQFLAITAQAKGLNLSADDKVALKNYAKNSKDVKRITASFKAFMTKNPTTVQQLIGVFMKLQQMMPK